MKSPSAPSAPPPPPAPIESLAAADKELKSLTGRNFAMGGGGNKAAGGGIANHKWGGVFAQRAQKNDRVSQLTAYIEEQMATLDKSRKAGGKGRSANIQSPKPGAAPKGLGNPENKDQVLL